MVEQGKWRRRSKEGREGTGRREKVERRGDYRKEVTEAWRARKLCKER